MTNAPFGQTADADPTCTPNIVEMKASAPTNVVDSTNYKNHGEYVSSQGGGSDAAHSCIGMPIQSSTAAATQRAGRSRKILVRPLVVSEVAVTNRINIMSRRWL